jgi:hypothetical protein
MTATFRGHEGRHLVVYGDAKVPGRFVGVSVVVDKGSGAVEGVEMMISAKELTELSINQPPFVEAQI